MSDGGLIIIVLLFGIVSAMIASAKGRNPFLWFIWGCLFLAFAILVIANLPKQEEQ